MCILFLAIKQHPDYPIIICANRDEFHKRPTRKAQFWKNKPYLLAGKDLQAGGSWLGINTEGRFAAITNIRNGVSSSVSKRSRGELVTLALEPNSPVNFDWLERHSGEYNPFNLTYGSLEQLHCFSSSKKQQTELTDGFHAISNGELDDIWPKMALGERQLEKSISGGQVVNNDHLFNILKDQTQASDLDLPITGIPVEWEQKLSSIFITSEEYGTRSSCILLQSENRTINFIEQTYDNEGKIVGEGSFVVVAAD